jgi:leucyl-tRNA---protein transferase
MRDNPQFYMTSPSPCPYLPEREERKVFTHLVGSNAKLLNNALTQSGFRRSQTIAYKPACEQCRSCVSVRVLVDTFAPSRNLRRVLDRNPDILVEARPPIATEEQYNLFHRYLMERHHDGGMMSMTLFDFGTMIEETHIDTRVIEYRHQTGKLLGVCLTDILADGLSMVYSFYEPVETRRSFGSYMVLDHIKRARRLGLSYLYLGYWVEGSAKMAYKSRFMPQERLLNGEWTLITE